MPLLIKFNGGASTQQAQTIPDATPSSEGLMTAVQAAELESLAEGYFTFPRVTNSATAAGRLGKISSVSGRLELLQNATMNDSFSLAVCVFQSGGLPGDTVLVAQLRGQDAMFQLDGAGSVSPGDTLYLSLTEDGAVSSSSASEVIVTQATSVGVPGGLVGGIW